MRWPLRDALRSTRRPDGPTLAFGLAMLWLWGGSLAVAALPQPWLARCHHQGPVGWWALTQTIPFMYTLETRWTVVREGPARPDLAAPCAARTSGVRQHVPLATLTAPADRPFFRYCGLPATVEIRSRIRAHEVVSRWRLTEEGGALRIQEAP